MAKYPFPSPNNELCQLVGRLAIHWSHIEHFIHSIIPGLLKGDGQIGYMLSRNLGNRIICEFLNTLAGEAEDEFISTGLKNIATEFDRLLGVRNRIVHNLWLPQTRGSSQSTRKALVARFRGNIRYTEETWRIAQIEKTIQECVELQHALECFTLETDLIDPIFDWQEFLEPNAIPLARSNAVYQNRDPKIAEWIRQFPPYRRGS
jgi:hypothetical protein